MRIFLLVLYRDHLMAVHMERKKKKHRVIEMGGEGIKEINRRKRRRRGYATWHELRAMKKSVLIPADRHPCDVTSFDDLFCRSTSSVIHISL